MLPPKRIPRTVDGLLTSHHSRLGTRCTECGRQFGNVKVLERHVEQHQAERPHRCIVCYQRFETIGELTVHKATHRQPGSDASVFVCTICHREFPTATKLVTHKIGHTRLQLEEARSAIEERKAAVQATYAGIKPETETEAVERREPPKKKGKRKKRKNPPMKLAESEQAPQTQQE
jgi:hypothetical protein